MAMRNRKPKAFHTQRENLGTKAWVRRTTSMSGANPHAWVFKPTRVDGAYNPVRDAPSIDARFYQQLRPEAMADSRDMFGGRVVSAYRGQSGYHQDHTGDIVNADLDRPDMGKRVHAGWAYNARSAAKIRKNTK